MSDIYQDGFFNPSYAPLSEQLQPPHLLTTGENTGPEKLQMVAEMWQPSSLQSSTTSWGSQNASVPVKAIQASTANISDPVEFTGLSSPQRSTRPKEMQQMDDHSDTLAPSTFRVDALSNGLFASSTSKPVSHVANIKTGALSTRPDTLLDDPQKRSQRLEVQALSAYVDGNQVGAAFALSQQLVVDLSSNACARSKGQALRRQQPAISEEARKTQRKETRRRREDMKKQRKTVKCPSPTTTPIPNASLPQSSILDGNFNEEESCINTQGSLRTDCPAFSVFTAHNSKLDKRACGQARRYHKAQVQRQSDTEPEEASISEWAKRTPDTPKADQEASHIAEERVGEAAIVVASILMNAANEQTVAVPKESRQRDKRPRTGDDEQIAGPISVDPVIQPLSECAPIRDEPVHISSEDTMEINSPEKCVFEELRQLRRARGALERQIHWDFGSDMRNL